MAEKPAGRNGLCQGRVSCAAKRSESLDTSRFPAILLRCGSLIGQTCTQNVYNELQLFLHYPSKGGGELRSGRIRNIFDIFFLPQVPFIDRGQNFARIYGTTTLKRLAVACRQCSVPLESLNVPKSTSRRFRHFKHLLRNLFEVKKKDSLKESNKCVLYGFYTNNVLVRP